MGTKGSIPIHFSHRNRLSRIDGSCRKNHRLNVLVCSGNAHTHRVGRLTKEKGKVRIGLLDSTSKSWDLEVKETPNSNVDAGLV